MEHLIQNLKGCIECLHKEMINIAQHTLIEEASLNI